MNGINAFEDHLNAIIAHAKAEISINHMTDENGNPANWDSKVWVYTNDNHQSINFIFTTESMPGAHLSTHNKSKALPSPLREVCMLYAFKVTHENGFILGMRDKIAVARAALASITSVEDLSHQQLKTLFKGKSSGYFFKVNKFINFLNDSILQHDPIRKLKSPEIRKTGEETEIHQKEKLPDEKSIAALGCIIHDTIPLQKTLWKTGPRECQSDAFICTMAALAMGAPNRVAAEQTVLDSQRLQKHTEKTNNNEEVVHFLNWKGSKSYKNNKNHILGIVAECVERCLDYMREATKPVRILSTFYADPTLPLKSILRKKDCDAKRWKRVQPNLNKPTNMVTLGYLIGLYDKGATVRVVEGTDGAYKEKNHSLSWCKPVWAIKNDDVLYINGQSIGDFIGLKDTAARRLFKELGISGQVPLKEVQAKWVTHIKRTFPDFPTIRNNTKKGVCDARTMMFSLSGAQFGKGKIRTPGGRSHFFPVSPTTLGGSFADQIDNQKNHENIFTRHGFSKEFSIKPHQFRHYINHTAFENGVPKLIINLWSGRKDPTQVLHYIHTNDADQAAMVSDIMFNEVALDIEQAKFQIRVLSRQEYNELTGSIASEASSGICTQALHITPCEYLNDFETQCVLCEKSCHVAHDDEAIALLNKDLNHQQLRLEKVASSPQFNVSKASQDWYKVHAQQTEMLTQLLAFMADKEIPKGSLIRLLSTQNEFRITNLKTKKVEVKRLCLPNTENEIAKIINKISADDHSNDVVNELLELI
jgi:hypothetical protein